MNKHIFSILFAVAFLLGVSAVSADVVPIVGGQCVTYAPVCGQKLECACSSSTYGVPCTGCYLIQKTYSNTCMLNNDGAQLLHYGACTGTGGGSTINQAPRITSFSGPTNLTVGQTGTWTIQANDPEGGYLTYDINWGDEPVYAYSYSNQAQSSFTQSTSIQHVYSSAGTYTITITVRDSSGKTVSSSTNVSVKQQYIQPQPNYYNYYNYQYPYNYTYPYYNNYNNSYYSYYPYYYSYNYPYNYGYNNWYWSY